MAYFPASGYRLASLGVLQEVGSGGYSWSSTTIGEALPLADFLGFRTDAYLYPLRRDNRPYGFPVRCVQELIND
ncbi:hypothetical protein [Bacteroides sp.]